MSKPTGFKAFLASVPSTSRQAQIEAMSPKDLEVLAQIIVTRRNQKVIADAGLMRAEEQAKEAAAHLIAAIDEYEAEVLDRGLLFRK